MIALNAYALQTQLIIQPGPCCRRIDSYVQQPAPILCQALFYTTPLPLRAQLMTYAVKIASGSRAMNSGYVADEMLICQLRYFSFLREIFPAERDPP